MKAYSENFFAEVIESSLDKILAQSWQWDYFPEFGSLVSIESNNKTTLGLVTHIQTGSMDPMRYPFPYKKTEQELLKEQPQIFEFLKTTFKVQVVGYINGTSSAETSSAETSSVETSCIQYLLPTKPCKIHSFIRKVDSKIAKQFFSNAKFLHLLFAFGNSIENLDELLLAVMKKLEQHKMLSKELMQDFCQTFSLLTGNDYIRLKIFLQRATT